MRAACAAALLALAGCGYQPPPRTDVASAAYKTDLAACEGGSAGAVNKQNAKRALDWLSSPVRRWGQIDEATQSCMAGKGYGRLRWCTADELKRGAGGGKVVTSAGVQCADPPDAARRKPAT